MTVLVNLLPVVALLVVGWLLLVRPAQRRSREAGRLQSSLEVGDEVMLTSGFYGTLRSLGEDRAEVELAPGTTVSVARGAIATVVRPEGYLAPAEPTASADQHDVTLEPHDTPLDEQHGGPGAPDDRATAPKEG